MKQPKGSVALQKTFFRECTTPQLVIRAHKRRTQMQHFQRNPSYLLTGKYIQKMTGNSQNPKEKHGSKPEKSRE